MKIIVSILAVVALACPAFADPLSLGADATIEKLLTSHAGKVVTVKTGCSEELTGKVKTASAEVVHLTELTGKEYFDAVVATDSISAVIIRTR
jgi:hypothetical protein